MSAVFWRMRGPPIKIVYFCPGICYNSIGLINLELAKQF